MPWRLSVRRGFTSRQVTAATASALLLGTAVVLAVPAVAAPAPPAGTWIGRPSTTLFSGSLGAGATRAITVTGVPARAAAWLTLSETGATAPGTLTAYTHAGTVPVVPTLVFAAGQAASNAAAVLTSSAGQVDVRNTSTHAVNVRVDVTGYYATGAATAAGAYRAVTPVRVANAVPVPAHGTVNMTVIGGTVPSTARVVLANLTAAAPTAAGVLTAYPAGTAAPDIPSLALSTGRPAAGLNAVRVGNGGRITVRNNSPATVRVSASVLGYYLAGASSMAGAFTKTPPARLVNTAIAADSGYLASATGAAGVPSAGVSDVVLQLAVSGATAPGYLTAYAAQTPKPTIPYVRVAAGRPVANLVVVPLGANGEIVLANVSNRSLIVRAYVVGYIHTASQLTWSPATRIGTVVPGFLMQLSCPTSSFCMGVDAAGNTLLWNGSTWTRHLATFPRTSLLTSLSCTGPSFCLAMDSNNADTFTTRTWNGSRWSAAPSVPKVFTASCVSSSWCLGFTEDSQWTRWNGTTWSTPANPPAYNGAFGGLSCVSTTFCMVSLKTFSATEATFTAARFDGTSWGPELPAGTTQHSSFPDSAISCSSASYCLLVGSAGQDTLYAKYNGTAFTAVPNDPQSVSSPQVSCASPTLCLVASPSTTTVVTFDGTTRHYASPITGSFSGGLAACSAAANCRYALGSQVSRWTGTAWATPQTIDPDAPDGLTSISCPSASFCAAADSDFARTFNGSSWSAGRRLTTSTDIYSSSIVDVSCTSATFCLAVLTGYQTGGNGWATYNGSTWTVHDPDTTSPMHDLALQGVSCVSPTFCVALTTADFSTPTAFVFNGSGWKKSGQLPGMSVVGCASRTFCLALGSTGTRPIWSRFNGTTWSAPATFGTAGSVPTDVSCASTTSCIAVDDHGHAIGFNGATWAGAVSVATGPLDAISCLTRATCVAVGRTVGYVQYLGAGHWSAPAAVPGLGSPVNISCPTAGFCEVVDDYGWAVTGRAR